MSQSWWMHFSLPYCLSSHMVTAQTEMEWVNGCRNHSHTSIQVICGRVWIESTLFGLSLKIPCYSHICAKKRTGKQHQWHSRRRNGGVWATYYVTPPYPPTDWSKAVCASMLSSHRDSLWYSRALSAGNMALMPQSSCPNPSAQCYLTDKRLIHRVSRR